ncbi:hypothetical protein L7F22_060046 [Adiantum nelumboides]|nr:hypothetical protein [Adiantum nelumboides]
MHYRHRHELLYLAALGGNVLVRELLASASNFAPLLEKVSICFAASGDMCNLIEIVCQLADDYKGDCTIHVNDADPKVAVRNYIMLELWRMYGDKAIDAAITLWYSIGMTARQLRATKVLAKKASKKAQGWALGEIKNSGSSSWYICYSASCGDGGSTLGTKFEKKTSETMKELCKHTTPLEIARLRGSNASNSHRETNTDRVKVVDKTVVLGNALVNMYARCGVLQKAQKVLEELPVQSVISWSAVIVGYAQLK